MATPTSLYPLETLESEHLAIRAARHAINRMAENYEAIESSLRRIQGDARLSESAKQEDSRQALAGLAAAPFRPAETALRELSEARQTAGQGWEAKVMDGADNPRTIAQDAELRALIRAMPPADRTSFVRQAIAAVDAQLIRAVLTAHPMVAGLEPATFAALRDEARAAVDPASYQLDRDLRTATVRLRAASGTYAAHLATLGWREVPSWATAPMASYDQAIQAVAA